MLIRVCWIEVWNTNLKKILLKLKEIKVDQNHL